MLTMSSPNTFAPPTKTFPFGSNTGSGYGQSGDIAANACLTSWPLFDAFFRGGRQTCYLNLPTGRYLERHKPELGSPYCAEPNWEDATTYARRRGCCAHVR